MLDIWRSYYVEWRLKLESYLADIQKATCNIARHKEKGDYSTSQWELQAKEI